MKKFILKFGSMFASLAIAIVALDANTICFFIHQPKLPEAAKKFRRF